MRPKGRYWLLVLLPLTCGACAPFDYGAHWMHGLFGRAATAPEVTGQDAGGWNALGALQPGQSGVTPSGETAQVKDSWLSALGRPCKRLTLGQGTTLICQSQSGWYALRDMAGGGE